ncbi:MAG: HD domain-containing protein [Chitinispirillaceae bacterium]|nr:HD domain-containing protein [Chitinispirillaceae bacterium]
MIYIENTMGGWTNKLVKYPETILLINDDNSTTEFLSIELTGKGFHCEEAKNLEETGAILRNHNIDVVIASAEISGHSSADVLAGIHTTCPDIAVIMMISHKAATASCIKSGAYDCLMKPIVTDELHFSVNRAFERQRLTKQIHEYDRQLDDKLKEKTGRIQASLINTIRALVYALEAKDGYTSGHSQRVADISASIARELSLPQDTVDKIVLAALVHDIGKIGIKESILHKPDGLNKDEQKEIQKHPEIGERIMGPVVEDEEILKYIRYHHGRFDGSGYPDTLSGYQIPLGARILAVADSFEAMTSERPYRKAMSDEEAFAELVRGKGDQFDPEVVEAFLRCKNKP